MSNLFESRNSRNGLKLSEKCEPWRGNVNSATDTAFGSISGTKQGQESKNPRWNCWGQNKQK